MTAQYHDTEEADANDEAGKGRLRSAMLADGQPAFHWWLLLPGIALAVLWAAYQGVSAEAAAGAAFAHTLLWPGPAIFILTTLTAYFGWRLDLD